MGEPSTSVADGSDRVSHDEAALSAVLELVRARHGVDFCGYRGATIQRRVRNRMISAGAPDVARYLDRLRADPAESARLLEGLTIKVSRFFRNAEAVDAVRRALRDRLTRAPGPLAVWSAGCGRGEEPYTLALLLSELAQSEVPSAEVLATDVDAAALAAAARGSYAAAALAEVPPPLRERYFVAEPAPTRVTYRVADGLRRRVELRRHDLAGAEGPPGHRRFDLVVCRNTLIYFDAPLQRRVERMLLASLAPRGLLWLGEAEWLSPEIGVLLETVDRRARLFMLRGGTAWPSPARST